MPANPDKTLGAAVRPYDHSRDYDAVGDFLVRTYSTEGPHQNWIQPRWEYMHFHPYLNEASVARIGVWEAGGGIVAVAHHEHRLGEVYVEVAPGWASLKPEMLDYASGHLAGIDEDGPHVAVYIDDRDRDFCEAAAARGFSRTDRRGEETSVLTLDAPLPCGRVPAGFRVSDVEHDNDLAKLHRLLHRGFNHPGEPDPAELPGRRKMQSAPNYRKDLNVVVAAPNGDLVSLCGTWFQPVNRVAMVEPVCTDPDFRALGLGKAAVLEAIRRCQKVGATVAYVGSTLPIYRSAGFKKVYTQHRWVKRL
jgi:GNAT superfamily N-acetyltransferase